MIFLHAPSRSGSATCTALVPKWKTAKAWPLPTGRRLWRMVGVPDSLALTVGGKMETVVLRGAFTLVSLAAAVALAAPGILERFR